jgi:hypothetical protein
MRSSTSTRDVPSSVQRAIFSRISCIGRASCKRILKRTYAIANTRLPFLSPLVRETPFLNPRPASYELGAPGRRLERALELICVEQPADAVRSIAVQPQSVGVPRPDLAPLDLRRRVAEDGSTKPRAKEVVAVVVAAVVAQSHPLAPREGL